MKSLPILSLILVALILAGCGGDQAASSGSTPSGGESAALAGGASTGSVRVVFDLDGASAAQRHIAAGVALFRVHLVEPRSGADAIFPMDVTRDPGAGRQEIEIGPLSPGTYHVVVEHLDSQGRLLGWSAAPASLEGGEATQIVVSETSAIESLAFAEAAPYCEIGARSRLHVVATLTDSSTAIFNVFVAWRSLDTALATVDGRGLVTGKAQPGTTIFASRDGIEISTFMAVTTGPPFPTVSGFFPSVGTPGDIITISGTNLRGAGVQIGDEIATVLESTDTSVRVIVPPGQGSVRIRIGTDTGSVVTSELFQYIGKKSFIVAVGDDATMITSSDLGRSWSKVAAVIGVRHLASIAYGNATFVAVGEDVGGRSVIVKYENQGWFLVLRAPVTPPLRRVVFGDRQFLAVGDGGTILTSPDGFNWLQQNPGEPSVDFSDADFGGNRWVAVGVDRAAGETVIVSSDDHGATWTRRKTASVNDGLDDVAFGSDGFVVPGGNGSVFNLLRSVDGANWGDVSRSTSVGLPPYGPIAFGSGRYVVLAGDGSALVSPVAAGFRRFSTGLDTTDERGLGLTFSDGFFVAVGERGSCAISEDGERWTRRSTGFDVRLRGACAVPFP